MGVRSLLREDLERRGVSLGTLHEAETLENSHRSELRSWFEYRSVGGTSSLSVRSGPSATQERMVREG